MPGHFLVAIVQIRTAELIELHSAFIRSRLLQLTDRAFFSDPPSISFSGARSQKKWTARADGFQKLCFEALLKSECCVKQFRFLEVFRGNQIADVTREIGFARTNDDLVPLLVTFSVPSPLF
jgi:hypothetical protein